MVPWISPVVISPEALDESNQGWSDTEKSSNERCSWTTHFVIAVGGGNSSFGHFPPRTPIILTTARREETKSVLKVEHDGGEGLHLIHEPKFCKCHSMEPSCEDTTLRNPRLESEFVNFWVWIPYHHFENPPPSLSPPKVKRIEEKEEEENHEEEWKNVNPNTKWSRFQETNKA